MGASQDPETEFGSRVSWIGGDDERLVEENFLGFAASNVVLGRIFGQITCIPFEAGVPGGIEGHELNLYMRRIYTSRAKRGAGAILPQLLVFAPVVDGGK